MQALRSVRIRRVVLLIFVVVGSLVLACHIWAWWQYRAGQEACARREFAQAQERFEQCSKIWFLSSGVNLQAGRAARRAGNLEAAASHLHAGQALGGPQDKLDRELALLRVQKGDLLPAAMLENLLEQGDADSVAILEVLTPAYIQGYRLQNALDCIGRWLEREPERVEAWQYRAEVYGRLQSNKELLESYRRILELNPENAAVRLQLAGQLLQSRQAKAAFEQYEQLHARLGDTPPILYGLACCLDAVNQPEHARQLLDKVLAEQPHHALALAERGRLAMEYESPAEAEPWLRRALTERPAEHDVLYSLYQCLQRLGKVREAAEIQARLKAVESDLQQLREAIQQVATAPHDPEPRYRAGLILLRNSKDEDGLRWLASALVEDPRHEGARRALADYRQRSAAVTPPAPQAPQTH
jgi:Tfp pilus assembly protein PilF